MALYVNTQCDVLNVPYVHTHTFYVNKQRFQWAHTNSLCEHTSWVDQESQQQLMQPKIISMLC